VQAAGRPAAARAPELASVQAPVPVVAAAAVAGVKVAEVGEAAQEPS
jgi:hypothetical protein